MTNIERWIEPAEQLHPGHELQRPVCKILNNPTVSVGRSEDNLFK